MCIADGHNTLYAMQLSPSLGANPNCNDCDEPDASEHIDQHRINQRTEASRAHTHAS